MQIGPFVFSEKEYHLSPPEAGEGLSADIEMAWYSPFLYLGRVWTPRADFRRGRMKLLVLEWEQLYLFEDELEAQRTQLAALALATIPTMGVVLEEEKAGVYYYSWPIREGHIRLKFFERQENASHFLTVLFELHGNWKEIVLDNAPSPALPKKNWMLAILILIALVIIVWILFSK